MHSVAIIARLKTGAEQQATELLAQGPPFDPDEIGLQRHVAYVCGDEVVFVFEGSSPEGEMLTLSAEDPTIARAAEAWAECLNGRPRLARSAFSWKRPQTEG